MIINDKEYNCASLRNLKERVIKDCKSNGHFMSRFVSDSEGIWSECSRCGALVIFETDKSHNKHEQDSSRVINVKQTALSYCCRKK